MSRVSTAESSAPAAVAWSLVARPDRWSRWAPHVRGSWGLGSPEVEQGRLGAVRLLGVIPVPARVLEVDPGRRWGWRVGPARLDHLVEPTATGCRVTMILSAPRPVEATYGRVVDLFVRRLARAAEASAGTDPV